MGLLQYVAPSPLLDVNTSANPALATLLAIAEAQGGAPSYKQQVLLTNANISTGPGVIDLTAYYVTASQAGQQPQVAYDSTAEVPESCTFELDFTDSPLPQAAIRWGQSQIQLYQLISHPAYQSGAWFRFPVGAYVITTPGQDDMDASEVVQVTGYGLNYLLQTEPPISFAFAAGSAYATAVRNVFRALGIIGSSAALSTVCNYPADWAAKTMPTAMIYPLGSGQTGAQIINDLLQASGCIGIYTTPFGGWQIDLNPTPAQQPFAFQLAGDFNTYQPSHFPAAKIVVQHKQQYVGDVYGVPNEWVFIQDGLTFQPTEGSGQYTVDNTSQPPSDQVTVGRVVRVTQTLQASGQADLVSQGNKIVTAALSAAEQVTLTMRPWPILWHYDVFQFTHPALPYSARRRLQQQQWTLPLDGTSMTVVGNAVATI